MMMTFEATALDILNYFCYAGTTLFIRFLAIIAANDVVLRFQDVTFEYNPNKKTLDEASCSIRTGSKIALM